MNYIFSFSSRNSALRFCDAIKAYGGNALIVNTPIKGGFGCGLSVKCDDYELANGILGRGNYSALRAVYSFDGESYETLYNIGGN